MSFHCCFTAIRPDTPLSRPFPKRAAGSLNDFKTFFPSRSAAKGSELVLVKLPANAGLAVEFEGQVLGTLDDPIVGREVFASYFLDGGKEISPKVRHPRRGRDAVPAAD